MALNLSLISRTCVMPSSEKKKKKNNKKLFNDLTCTLFSVSVSIAL